MTVDLDSMLMRMRLRLVMAISTHPSLYYGLRKMTGTMDHLCINEDTEIVIEGYPRSANSTTAYGFLARQTRPVRLAHHKHHAAQLLLAAKQGIPSVMLIRQPEQAVISNLALMLESQKRKKKKKKGTITFEDALRAWLVFYRAVEPCNHAFVIAPFEEVTQDIGGMIRSINRKFGTNFSDEAPPQGRVEPLGWHATPNEIRNAIKNQLSKNFAQALAHSTHLRTMLIEANSLYQRFIKLSEAHH